MRGEATESFALAADTNPAPEILYLRSGDVTEVPASAGELDLVDQYQVSLETLGTATGATVEVEALREGGDPATAADWNLLEQETTVGIKAKKEVVGKRMRIRMIAASNAGTAVCGVSWRGGKDG